MTHVEEKSFECNICQKKFALKKTLQVHEASHKRENKNPYQCSFCAKSFRYVANLNAHELIHTGKEKQFSMTHKLSSSSMVLLPNDLISLQDRSRLIATNAE